MLALLRLWLRLGRVGWLLCRSLRVLLRELFLFFWVWSAARGDANTILPCSRLHWR
jgi:hypothetical protein